MPAAKFRLCCAAEFYILTGLLSDALPIVSIPACRSNRYKHFLLPLGFSAGCIWFTFNYLPVLRSLPPLAWVSTSVSLRVCSADWLRRLVPISSMAAVWVCTAVLFTSSIPERTFSWMMFSSCVEHKQAVNIVSYGNQTSDLPHHLCSLPWASYSCGVHLCASAVQDRTVPCRAKHYSSVETCFFTSNINKWWYVQWRCLRGIYKMNFTHWLTFLWVIMSERFIQNHYMLQQGRGGLWVSFRGFFAIKQTRASDISMEGSVLWNPQEIWGESIQADSPNDTKIEASTKEAQLCFFPLQLHISVINEIMLICCHMRGFFCNTKKRKYWSKWANRDELSVYLFSSLKIVFSLFCNLSSFAAIQTSDWNSTKQRSKSWNHHTAVNCKQFYVFGGGAKK